MKSTFPVPGGRHSCHQRWGIWGGDNFVKPTLIFLVTSWTGRIHFFPCVSLLYSRTSTTFTKLRHQAVWSFAHTKQLCETSCMSYNLTQFWYCLTRQRQIPQVKGSAPQDCPPCQLSISNTRSPGFLQFLSDLPINWSFLCPPLTPTWIQLIFIMIHKTQENSLLTVVKKKLINRNLY